jgi:hypothetical protein
MVKISEMLEKDERTLWVKYLDNFEIEIRYLPRSELSRLVERSKETTWDKKDHTKVERMNSDSFYTNFINKVIVTWKGLTALTLAKMIPVKIDDPNQEIDFSFENAFTLIKNAYDFDVFLQNTCMDLDKFSGERLEDEKKI